MIRFFPWLALAGRFALAILLVAILLLVGRPAFAQFTDQRTWGGTSGGSANAQTLSIANYASYLTGVPIRFIAGATNTTAGTLNINSLGAKNVYKVTPTGPIAFTGGELVLGQIAEVVYDGTQFQLISNSNATAAQVVTSPQGRLTLSTGTPVMTGNVSAATSLYYTPYVGNQVPVYNGTTFTNFSFSQVTVSIPSSRLANLLYDVCAFNNSGSLQVAIGPAWSSSTAGSSSRGTGAGTAELQQVNGIWTNAVSISAVNGGTTYTVGANLCTYLGTIHMDGTNGQVSYLPAVGQSRKLGVWNAYNRVPYQLSVADPTSSWAYNSATIRASRNDSTNSAAIIDGLAVSMIDITNTQKIELQALASTGGAVLLGIGWNSTTAFSGTATGPIVGAGSSAANVGSPGQAAFTQAPALGLNTVVSLESGTSAVNTTIFSGTSASMRMVIRGTY